MFRCGKEIRRRDRCFSRFRVVDRRPRNRTCGNRQNPVSLDLSGNGLEIKAAPNGSGSRLGLPAVRLVFDDEGALWCFHNSSISSTAAAQQDPVPPSVIVKRGRSGDPEPLAQFGIFGAEFFAKQLAQPAIFFLELNEFGKLVVNSNWAGRRPRG